MTILSYHLKYNLAFNDEFSLMHLGDDISADLDIAMISRRDNVPGKTTPEGILTKYKHTTFGQLIRDIDSLNNPNTIDLGFLLLELGGDSIEKLNEGIEKIAELARKDGKLHDFSLGFDEGKTGITIHCNSAPTFEAAPRLESHCYLRKYKLKAKSWFGISIDPYSKKIKFGVNLSSDWEQSEDMDKAVLDLKKPQHLRSQQSINFKTTVRSGKKIGANEKCPCGSGRKYKRCCRP